MDKIYNPQSIEPARYKDWDSKGLFAPDAGKTGYCIMLPPPNVTGRLHMGHAFQQTLMDALIRYHRMNGDSTLWQCGTDHAGIATQMVVERQLESQHKSRRDLGREQFIEAVWKWKQRSGNAISRQSRRLGASMDWSRERFTMDQGLSNAVKQVFIKLYDEGLIYRGKRLVNWDPVLRTAVSDLEVVSEQERGHLWHIRYPLAEPGNTVVGDGYIVVATTRPETMLGDAAVAVHPDDQRYQALIGRQLELPLTGRTIAVIADDYVDPEFGTGCVKITPAHDFNDYQVGQRHGLERINIFTADAAMNENAPAPYRGMSRERARKQIVADLAAADCLEKTEDYTLMVPRSDRSQAVIEPYLTDQWYIRIEPLAGPAINAVENGDIKFIPAEWAKTYFEWMANIEDWCISRQLWWGHRIPAWYDQRGNIYVANDEADVRKKYQLDDSLKLRQDEDVLDTWFSSALWPFSTLGWPEQTGELAKFYPTDVLVTGFDIIFFWVARMIMMGLKFTGQVPFRQVYIHGLVRDGEGQKMSKSKGNILDPLDLIDGIELETLVKKRTEGLMQPRLAPRIEAATRKHFPNGISPYGTDSLRFTFASLATQGRDIRFDVERIEGYRNFCNKLWNAARYILMNIDKHAIDINRDDRQLGLAEQWINTRLSEAIIRIREGFHGYRFDLAAQAAYGFTWNEYCDWYLEWSKTTLNDDSAHDDSALAARRCGTLFTLVNTFEILLRSLHPIMPFITEELWQKFAPLLNIEADTIMLQAYPDPAEVAGNPESLAEFEWLKTFIIGVRKIRAERDIAPGKGLAVTVKDGSDAERTWLERNKKAIQMLGKIDSIADADIEPDDAVAALAGSMTLLVPLAALIDPAAELGRLQKQLDSLQRDKDRLQSKIGNKQFAERAPDRVVARERNHLAEVMASLEKLEAQYERIKILAD